MLVMYSDCFFQDVIVLRKRNKGLPTGSKSEGGGLFKTLLNVVYLEKIEGGKVWFLTNTKNNKYFMKT